MRHTPQNAARLALALLVLALAAPQRAHAEAGDRLDVTVFGSRNIERLHSIAADTLGLSYHTSLSGGANVDFRVLDLPFGKGARKPALHVSGGVCSDSRVLGPALPGMTTAAFPLLDFSGGVALELPLDAFLTGNSGVGLRLGWEGGYMLTRSGGQSFLERSRGHFDFVRTSGGLAGSFISVGKGRDEIYGWDAAGKRWDVGLSLQARLIGAAVPAAAPAAGKAALAKGASASPAVERMVWLFVDADVNTDGGPGPDGLRARAGLGIDLDAFVTAAFTPLRP